MALLDSAYAPTTIVLPEIATVVPKWSNASVFEASLQWRVVDGGGTVYAQGNTTAKLWTLEENWSARRYYEKRGWTLTPETRVVPFPPNPIDVQYAKKL